MDQRLKKTTLMVKPETWLELKNFCHLEGIYLSDALDAAILHWLATQKQLVYEQQQTQLQRRKK